MVIRMRHTIVSSINNAESIVTDAEQASVCVEVRRLTEQWQYHRTNPVYRIGTELRSAVAEALPKGGAR